MEGEHQDGDVGREEVRIEKEPDKVEQAEREEESRDKRPAEILGTPIWPLYETAEELGAAEPERAEENAAEEVPLSTLVPETPAPEAEEPGTPLQDGQADVGLNAIAPEPSEAADVKVEIEAPKPPKKRRTRQKRTDKARRKPAKKRTRKMSAKRPAKKRKKSRA